MASDKRQLDTTIQIVTPENIAFQYRAAGPFQRLSAYLIDLCIRLTAGLVSLFVFLWVFGAAGLPGFGFGITLIVWFLLAWFYGGAFEALNNGRTPGKWACQLRVLSEDGQPVNGVQAVLRNILRAVDLMPMIGLLAMMLNDRFQRLGDLVCGTIVVVEDRPWFAGLIRVTEPEAIRLAGQIPAGFQASHWLARTLAVYVQRRVFFTPVRRQEIAGHLGEALRQRLGLAPGVDFDMLLCAVYHRTFITDRNGDGLEPPRVGAPFAEGAARPAGAGTIGPARQAGSTEPSMATEVRR